VGIHKPTDMEIVKQSLDQLALYEACGQLVKGDSSFLKNDNYVTVNLLKHINENRCIIINTLT